MNALGCCARLATPCSPHRYSHRLEAARDSPRHHRQEAAAVQQVESLRLGCNHLLMAVQPHTQNRYHLSLPFVWSFVVSEKDLKVRPRWHMN